MNFLTHKHIRLFFCSALILWTNMGFCQKDIDDQLVQASMEIYENPDKAIQMGGEIYASPQSTVENKVRALMLISTGYSSKRNYEKSLEYAVMAKAYFTKLNSTSLKINILNKIANQYQQLNIYDKTIEYLNQALELTSHLPVDSAASMLGYNYAVRGFIYREQMSCAIALDYFDKSIEQFRKISNTPAGSANLSILIYNKGNCYIALAKIDSAKASFKRSMRYAQTVGANSLIAFAQKGLGEVHTLQGNYESSIAILSEALQISNNVGDLVLNKELYNAMGNNYLALNNWEKYAMFHHKFLNERQRIERTEQNTINRSIKNLLGENSKKVASLKLFYGVLHILLVLAVCSATIFLIFQFKKLRKKRKLIQHKLQVSTKGD